MPSPMSPISIVGEVSMGRVQRGYPACFFFYNQCLTLKTSPSAALLALAVSLALSFPPSLASLVLSLPFSLVSLTPTFALPALSLFLPPFCSLGLEQEDMPLSEKTVCLRSLFQQHGNPSLTTLNSPGLSSYILQTQCSRDCSRNIVVH